MSLLIGDLRPLSTRRAPALAAAMTHIGTRCLRTALTKPSIDETTGRVALARQGCLLATAVLCLSVRRMSEVLTSD